MHLLAICRLVITALLHVDDEYSFVLYIIIFIFIYVSNNADGDVIVVVSPWLRCFGGYTSWNIENGKLMFVK